MSNAEAPDNPLVRWQQQEDDELLYIPDGDRQTSIPWRPSADAVPRPEPMTTANGIRQFYGYPPLSDGIPSMKVLRPDECDA